VDRFVDRRILEIDWVGCKTGPPPSAAAPLPRACDLRFKDGLLPVRFRFGVPWPMPPDYFRFGSGSQPDQDVG